MNREKSWLVLDIGDGWQAILPDHDINPHAKVVLISGEEKEAQVAEFNCPCKPSVDFGDKLIIHNSFDGREKQETQEHHEKRK